MKRGVVNVPGMSAGSEQPVLQYRWVGMPFFRGYELSIYATGRVTVTPSGGHANYERRIPPSEVDCLVTSLLALGFFTLEDEYKNWAIMDGWTDSLTLHYRGRRKTVKCTNGVPSPEYRAFIRVLKDIVQ